MLAQGALKTTDRDLDVALTKEDLFFTVNVQDENGSSTRLTRDGAFFLSPVNGNQTSACNSRWKSCLDESGDPIMINGTLKKLLFPIRVRWLLRHRWRPAKF